MGDCKCDGSANNRGRGPVIMAPNKGTLPQSALVLARGSRPLYTGPDDQMRPGQGVGGGQIVPPLGLSHASGPTPGSSSPVAPQSCMMTGQPEKTVPIWSMPHPPPGWEFHDPCVVECPPIVPGAHCLEWYLDTNCTWQSRFKDSDPNCKHGGGGSDAGAGSPLGNSTDPVKKPSNVLRAFDAVTTDPYEPIDGSGGGGTSGGGGGGTSSLPLYGSEISGGIPYNPTVSSVVVAGGVGGKTTMAAPFPPKIHEEITEFALRGILTEACIHIVAEANRLQDKGAGRGALVSGLPFDQAENHGDGGTLRRSMRLMKQRLKAIKEGWDCSKGCGEEVRPRLRTLGMVFHALQDMYTHANYVEVQGGYDPDDPQGRNRRPGFEKDVSDPNNVPLWNMDPERLENDDETGMEEYHVPGEWGFDTYYWFMPTYNMETYRYEKFVQAAGSLRKGEVATDGPCAAAGEGCFTRRLLLAHLVEFVDLREPSGSRSASQKWPRLEWWRAIVGDAKGIATPGRGDSAVWAWIEALRRQFGGALVVLLRAAGVDAATYRAASHDLEAARRVVSTVRVIVGAMLRPLSAEHELRLDQLMQENGRKLLKLRKLS